MIRENLILKHIKEPHGKVTLYLSVKDSKFMCAYISRNISDYVHKMIDTDDMAKLIDHLEPHTKRSKEEVANEIKSIIYEYIDNNIESGDSL